MDEFDTLTERHNSGDLSAEEYERWCELKRKLARTDPGIRRVIDRETGRLAVRLRAVVRMPQPVVVRTIDVSLGGIAVRAPSVAEAGTVVSVSLLVPGEEEPLDARVKVAWSDAARGT